MSSDDTQSNLGEHEELPANCEGVRATDVAECRDRADFKPDLALERVE